METQFIPAAARLPRQRVRSIVGLDTVALITAGLSAGTPANAALPQDSASGPPSTQATSQETLNVVVLGDSYTSGHGASSEYEDRKCRRSSSSYAPIAYNRLHVTWPHATSEFVTNTCTGATTQDVIEKQLDALFDSTDLVTLTIGGNDLHFADMARTGVLSGSAACAEHLGDAGLKIEPMKQPIIDVLRAIEIEAPNANIVMSGYPVIFDTGECGSFTISEDNRDQMIGMQIHFNEVIQSAVETVNA